MPNAIAISKPVKGGDERSAVVRDNLLDGSSSTQDVLEFEHSKGACGFDAKGAPFGPGCEGAACLDNVAEAGNGRHECRVDVSLAEDAGVATVGGMGISVTVLILFVRNHHLTKLDLSTYRCLNIVKQSTSWPMYLPTRCEDLPIVVVSIVGKRGGIPVCGDSSVRCVEEL